jgi:uncharacterized protein involved in type VI secretion and phage assembly
MNERDLAGRLMEWARSKHFGKYRGVVTDNKDPEKLGRLKVKVPSVLDTLELWAMPCVPYAGPSVGLMSLPPADAGVWVEFEGGDPSYPVWVGCYWHKGEIPEDGKPDIKIWKTDKLSVKLDDSADEMALANSSNAEVALALDITAQTSGQSKITVGPAGVVSEQGGAHKVEVTTASVKVNNGALEVV